MSQTDDKSFMKLFFKMAEEERKNITQEDIAIFMKFTSMQFTREVFAVYYIYQYHIYRALEEELDRHQEHPCIKPLYYPYELSRVAQIEKDLEFYYGDKWKERVKTMSPATERYVETIHKAADKDPSYLIAYIVIRYLNDLTNGPALAKRISKAFGLPPPPTPGTLMYHFPHIPNLVAFRKSYSETLDTLPMDRNAVLEEAKSSVLFTVALMRDLQVEEERQLGVRRGLGRGAMLLNGCKLGREGRVIHRE
ncbi:uncharacterized protein VTP21DRAFT_4886 [Calcarisporiella thermophila]|uniref:uncharacterized protein n=1 Tax=Calcarisporiella thermophila TaxID=911321 RepID=UPI00374248F7